VEDFDLSLDFSKNLKKKKKKKKDLDELMAEERKENEANDNGKYNIK
jgi:translation initiation factor 2 subunit 2